MNDETKVLAPLGSTAGLEGNAWAWKKIAPGSLPKDCQRVLFVDERHPDDVGIGYYASEDEELWVEAGGYWIELPPLPSNARNEGTPL